MSNKKKILLLTDWYEPGFKAGGPIRSCKNFVEALGEFFDLGIITSDRDQGDTAPYADIPLDTWIDNPGAASLYYAGRGQLTARTLQRLILDFDPDYVYLNSMYSFPFTILPLWLKLRRKISADIVIAPRGMLQDGAMQFKPLKKKLFIRLLNSTGIVHKLTFQATDEQERKDIMHYFPSAGKVQVAANFPKMEPVPWRPVAKHPGELRGAFLSRITAKKNLHFLLKALHDLPADVRFSLDLYGEVEDPAYWKKCCSLIEELPETISVHWKGPVPNEAVTGILQQHHIFVLPTLGENFGHAVFEALLAGKPVVISDKTPWRGLEGQRLGYDLPLKPDAFLQALCELSAMDQEAYDLWSRSAWEYAREIQSSAQLKETYKNIFP